MTPSMLCEIAGITGELSEAIESEVDYAVQQTRNDYESWLAPDEVEEYYIPLPLDDEGFPIHEVEIRIIENE